MNGDSGPKRKVRTGLVKLFRDALDEALERDPVQHIRDGYQRKMDHEFNTELGINSVEDDLRQDPIQRIRDSYDKRLDNENHARVSINSLEDELRDEPIRSIKEGFATRTNYKDDVKYNIDKLEEARRDEPVRRIRDTFDKILDSEYTEPTAVQEAPQKGKSNYAGGDLFQSVREAYDKMFDDKYQENKKDKDGRLPWWKKFF
jgi:hypothetical protein